MRNRVFILLASIFIALGAFSAPVQRSLGSVAVTAEAASQVASPSANFKSGTYYSKSGFYVTLSGTQGADIYYSINGGAYKLYTSKIAVTKNTTLKYYAQKNGVKSAVTTRSYKLAVKTVISHESGSYTGAQNVTLTSPAKNVKFYYTLDGSKPTTSSALYNGRSIRISSSCKLRVLAYKKGWTNYVYTRDLKIDKAEEAKQESLLENYKAKYAYSTLTPLQKTLYSLIYDGVKAHKSKIDLSSYSVTVDDINTAFYAMDYENPQFFWLASGYSYSYSGSRVLSISPKYTRTKSEAAAISPKLTASADKIVAAAAKKSSTFDKILYIHDAIVNATTYTTQGGEYKRDADGPLVNGKALCEGYAKAFAYLCQSLGYDTICVSGKGNGGDHMWNMIKLDGKWYYMDVTFDDPVSSVPICGYDYFCITEKQLLEDHSVDEIFPLQEATATKYNYYNGAGITYHTNATSAYNELVRTAAQNYSKGIYTTEIYADEKIMTELMGKIKADVFTSLGKYSCKPKGASYGYQGSKFYLTLS